MTERVSVHLTDLLDASVMGTRPSQWSGVCWQVENNTLPFLEREEEEITVHVTPIKQELEEEEHETFADDHGWALCPYTVQVEVSK